MKIGGLQQRQCGRGAGRHRCRRGAAIAAIVVGGAVSSSAPHAADQGHRAGQERREGWRLLQGRCGVAWSPIPFLRCFLLFAAALGILGSQGVNAVTVAGSAVLGQLCSFTDTYYPDRTIRFPAEAGYTPGGLAQLLYSSLYCACDVQAICALSCDSVSPPHRFRLPPDLWRAPSRVRRRPGRLRRRQPDQRVQGRWPQPTRSAHPGTKVVLNFGASDALLQQIIKGAPVGRVRVGRPGDDGQGRAAEGAGRRHARKDFAANAAGADRAGRQQASALTRSRDLQPARA